MEKYNNSSNDNESRNEMIEKVCKLIEGIFAHGDFKSETKNERELEIYLKKLGYWSNDEKTFSKKYHNISI
jgi:rRNA pseudouridine-1189 N-methylase Emg1 (Nep1/Mra1 family)